MKIAIFCSIFLLPFPQLVHADNEKKTVCFGYGARLNVDAWHNGQMKYHFRTGQDNQNGGKQCVAINARRWSGMNAVDPIYFLDPDHQNAETIGEVRLDELRKTTAMSLMVKTRVYFTYNLGQQYSINVWNEHGQELLFTDDVLLDHSNNKQYLDIDPDQFGHLQGNAWINFSLAGHQNFSLGRAAVEVLRAIHSEIDFCGNDKNFGPTGSW
ncbi:hypothetical protein niasHS_008696 [Heterodera schachtii]|uniref:Uncharacterized protein n=1 Tax=Heterodera schachtii TaxID=97005 RepID=A0ABD2JAS0_HETSC